MDTKKRNVMIVAGVVAAVVLAVGVLAVSGVFRGFDPEGYVGAVLDQTLKGDAKTATKYMSGTSEKTLKKQYEAGITSFVKGSIISGVEVEESLEQKYEALCKKVFASMKYEVKNSEKGKDGGYEVTVSYQPTDVFTNFIAKVGEENQRLAEKVENGEYRGTLEEINSQIQKEFLENAYTLLEDCYESMGYAEKETYVFTITKDKKGMYDLDETQISEFITKILNLDSEL